MCLISSICFGAVDGRVKDRREGFEGSRPKDARALRRHDEQDDSESLGEFMVGCVKKITGWCDIRATLDFGLLGKDALGVITRLHLQLHHQSGQSWFRCP
jgi:hypothetical protein